MRVSRPEPFDLVRRSSDRETFASWYQKARSTVRSFVTLTSVPEMVVVQRPGEMAPAAAGAITGGVGGAVMLALATVLTRRQGQPVDIASMRGSGISRGALEGTAAFAVGVALCVLAGAGLGALFAVVTRRLRQLPALMALSLVLSTASWMVVQAVAIRHLAPWLARALPVAPMMIGAAVFGLVLSLELPLRTRRFG